jgi:hypothetical protein
VDERRAWRDQPIEPRNPLAQVGFNIAPISIGPSWVQHSSDIFVCRQWLHTDEFCEVVSFVHFFQTLTYYRVLSALLVFVKSLDVEDMSVSFATVLQVMSAFSYRLSLGIRKSRCPWPLATCAQPASYGSNCSVGKEQETCEMLSLWLPPLCVMAQWSSSLGWKLQQLRYSILNCSPMVLLLAVAVFAPHFVDSVSHTTTHRTFQWPRIGKSRRNFRATSLARGPTSWHRTRHCHGA